MRTPSPAGRIAESIVRRFEGLAGTRDRALVEGRQIPRLAANSVRATHRGELAEAEVLLGEALAYARAHPFAELLVRALTTTGLLQIAQGQPQAAPLDEAVALARQQELRRLLADALTAQSQRDGALGAVGAARAAWTEALALYTALKMPQARLAPAWLGGEKAP